MFRYRIAESGTDLEAWHRLRTRLYLESNLISDEDLDASGVYRDGYSEHSIHVLGSSDDGVDIGCVRMIEPADGHTLPVTDLFGVDVLPNAYEGSGIAIMAQYRKSFASLGFYRALHDVADERGYEYSYGIVEEPGLHAVRRLGFPIEVVGGPRHVFNASNVAVVHRRSDTLASLRAADAGRALGIAQLWERPFDWTLSESDLIPDSMTGAVEH